MACTMSRRQLAFSLFVILAGCSNAPETTQDIQMPDPNVDQSVIVSRESVRSDDPYDIVYSNITFLNALMEEHFTRDELSQDASRSYCVDYYLAQVNNGGFSQFVYNSDWEKNTIRYIREGLQAMGASRHLELFNQSASILDRIGPDGMERFFESEYFGENKERDILNEFDDKFYDLSEREDLIKLNSDWLKGLPNLVVMTTDEMKAEVERRAAALPDREARAAKALANEPRYMKLIRALCKAAGHELDRVTAGDPTHKYNGRQMISWHFLTDQGHFHMVDIDSKALMFEGHSDEVVCEIEASEEFGTE